MENTLERAATLCEGNTIVAEDLQLQASAMASVELPAQIAASAREGPPAYTGGNLDDYLAGVEKYLLEEALMACRWNKTAAAEKLGISFRQLRYKLKKLGID